jgi:hypothetical protein
MKFSDTKYGFDGEDVAKTIEFHSDVAISEIVHKGFIENPNDLSVILKTISIYIFSFIDLVFC